MKLSKLKDISSIGLSRILEAVLNGVFWFVLADWLSKSDYGEVTYLISIGMMGFGISGLGLNKLLVVYGAKKENLQFPTFILGLISSAISAVVVFFLTNNPVVSLLVVGLMVFNLHVHDLLSIPNYRGYSIFFIIRRSLSTILGLGLYPLFGIEGIVLGFILGTFPSFVGLYRVFRKPRISFSVLKNKIKFIVQNYAVVLIAAFRLSGIKLLIGSVFGFTLLSEFQLASQYLLVIGIIPSVISTYLLPQEAQGVSNVKLKLYSILVSVILAGLSVIFLPWGITNILPKYENVIFPIQIMSISIIPQVIAIILENDFLGRGKSQLVLISIVSSTVIFVVLLLLLGSFMGMEGIAYSFTISATSWAVINLFLKFYN